MNIYILATAVPVITLLVNGVKQMGLSSKWSPLVAMIIGTGVVMLLTGSHNGSTIITGLVTGLSSIGLYSGVKSTTETITGNV